MTLAEFRKMTGKPYRVPAKIIGGIMKRMYSMKMKDFHSDPADPFGYDWERMLDYWGCPGSEATYAEWVRAIEKSVDGDFSQLDMPIRLTDILVSRFRRLASNDFIFDNSARPEDVKSAAELKDMDDRKIVSLFLNIKVKDFNYFYDNILGRTGRCKRTDGDLTLGEALMIMSNLNKCKKEAELTDSEIRHYVSNILIVPFLLCFESEKNNKVRVVLFGEA